MDVNPDFRWTLILPLEHKLKKGMPMGLQGCDK